MTPRPSRPATLAEVLVAHASAAPQRRVIGFIDDTDIERELTYRELDRGARHVAEQLRANGQPGDRVLIAFDSGLDFVLAFWGTVYADMVAVPVDPPAADRAADVIVRLGKIASNSSAAHCLAAAETIEFKRGLTAETELATQVRWLALSSSTILGAPLVASRLPLPEASPDRVTALLYTSGSTGAPKGTIVTEEAFLKGAERHALLAEQRACKDVEIHWSPTTHATGFFRCFLGCAVPDYEMTWISPHAFLRSPMKWLRAISRNSAAGLKVQTTVPNFALDLCVATTTPQERAELDLSGWMQCNLIGERVRPETWRAFSSAFRDCRFNARFVARYGSTEAGQMAEAIDGRSLRFSRSAIAAGVLEVDPDGEVELQSSGVTDTTAKVIIVDPETRERVPEGRIGEIWSGSRFSTGYWGLPESGDYFDARSADGAGPFFRTGDLGGLHEGELFIAGRLKSVIIVRGHKYHAEDVEATLERRLEWTTANSVIAFSDDVNGERFFIALEVRHDEAEVAKKADEVRATVAEDYGVRVDEVVFIPKGSLPRTNSGKVARIVCRDLLRAGQLPCVARYGARSTDRETIVVGKFDDVMAAPTARERTTGLIDNIRRVLANALALAVDDVDATKSFREIGIDSAGGVRFTVELERWAGRPLPKTLVYNYPTIADVARYLGTAAAAIEDATGDGTPRVHDVGEPIAIIGVGCRFPGEVASLDSFWMMLANGVDAIGPPPEERAAYYRSAQMRDYRGGFLRHIEDFDHGFFSISKREAESMDPLQRLVLEVTTEALHDAGVPTQGLRGSTAAVFMGVAGGSGYSPDGEGEMDPYSATSNAVSVASGRVSYVLDLLGPTVTVDTACSSSLVAVHLACDALRSRGAHLAMAGGITLIVRHRATAAMASAGALSPDWRCKTFDASANGYVRSEGTGVVILKRLKDALESGDRILGIIKASGAASDGRSNGLTAPSGLAQQRLIGSVLAAARVRPDEVDYVEAHGTGTPLGDPIELEALAGVFRSSRPPERPLIVGSVKANIGHTEGAAGIAGLIKVLAMFRHGAIPRQLHFDRPNPAVPWADLAVEIPRQNRPWLRSARPRIAGVSSFGFGGAIAHCVLTEPALASTDADRDRAESGRAFVLPISAHSHAALQAYAEGYVRYLERGPTEATVRDLAFTASVRRDQHAHRLTVVGASFEHWRANLEAYLAGRARVGLREGVVHDGGGASVRKPVAFVFCGQGAQWWGMGRQLLGSEPVFRGVLENCDKLIRDAGGPAVIEELLRSEGESRLGQTAIAQPALFALQVALVALWRSWGVEPDAVVGHSVGEIAAAQTAGVLSSSHAARLVTQRGRIMQRATGRGRMGSVALPLAEAKQIVSDYRGRISVAASNSPTTTVLSGDSKALEDVFVILEKRGVEAKWLAVDYAFHSAQMAGFGDELERELAGITPSHGDLPIVSTVTGLEQAGAAFDARYWGGQIQRPVLFARAIETLVDKNISSFIEIGPHPVLAAAISETVAATGKPARPLPSLRRKEDERTTMLDALGALHCDGHPIDWRAQFPAPGHVVSLPAYPWQKERSWRDPVSRGRHRRQVRIGGADVDAHPFLLHHVQLSNPTSHVWETPLTVKEFPYLADHEIQGTLVFPGAGFAEIAVAAGKEALGEQFQCLGKLELVQPLVVRDDEPATLQCQLSPTAGGGGSSVTFQISSRRAATSDVAESTVVHATGTLQTRRQSDSPQGHAGSAEPTAPESVVARCAETQSGADFYDSAARAGNRFGPQFRNLDRVWRRDGEAIAKLVIAREVAAKANEYHLHPALLDAAFQAVGRAFKRGAASAAVVAGLDALSILGDPATSAWIHAVADEATSSAGVHRGDVFIIDGVGRVVVEVRGVRLHALERNPSEAWRASLHDLVWRPSISRTRPPEAPRRNALLFADEGGVGERVRAELERRGRTVVVVRRSESYGERGELEYGVAPHQPEHFRRLVAQPRVAALLVDADILHMWSLDAAETADLSAIEDTLRHGTISTLHLVQALAAAGGHDPLRLWLITRGTQAVGGGPVSVAQAPLWGFGATVANELPELHCNMVDLDPRSDDVTSLVAELDAPDGEGRIALRGGARYVQRVTRREGAIPLHARPKKRLLVGAKGYRVELGAAGMVDSLTLVEAERAGLGPHQVEVLVKASALNFRDVLMAMGAYPSTGEQRLPMGGECSGLVTAIGSAVRGIDVGEAVIVTGAHAFDSHVVVDASRLSRKPASLDFEDAAGVSVVFATVHYALHEVGRLRTGERILIHSAAGGVGLAAIQYARHVGAEVFATAGTEEKRALLRSMGIRHVFTSRSLEWAEAVMRETAGRGVDVVLNSLAGEAIAKGISVLAPFGRFLELGKTDVYADAKVGLYGFRNNVTVAVIALDQLAAERPEQSRANAVRVRELFDQGVFTPLPRQTFPIARIADAFRYMMPGKHVGKVVVTAADAVSVVAAPAAVRSDATYLITGGLAGLGLAVADWLVERGAKYLALVGRSTPTETAQASLDAMRAKGAMVEVFRADVAEWPELASVFARIAASMPALRGVIHSAGAVDDATIPNLEARRFLGPVIRAKIDGGWNLHRATAEQALDFFVLFSSIAALGSRGQGNYAAANAFLDALAFHRRALGLAATTINWGRWSEIGMATRGAAAKRNAEGVSTSEGLDLFRRIVEDDATQSLVIGPAHRAMLARTDSVLFEELRTSGKMTAGANQLREQPFASGPEQLEALIRNLVAVILRTDPAAIDPTAPLLSLGLDSLMALELRARLREKLGIEVVAMNLISHPTLKSLVAFAASKIRARPSSDAESSPRVLKLLKSGGPKPKLRLVCFPPAGSEPDEFADWARVLPGNVELCAVVYPGSAARAAEPVGPLSASVLELVEALTARRAAAPLALFGHSLGAIVACAAAQELERRGQALAYAVFSSAPLLERSGRRFKTSTRSEREQLIEFMRSININTEPLLADTELSRRFLTVFAEQLNWSADFSLGEALLCPIALFQAERDVMSTPAAIDQWSRGRASVEVHRFPGDHGYVRTELEAIIERILGVIASTRFV